MDIVNCTPNQWYDKEMDCLQMLQNENIWNQIPLLNANELHNLKDARLVRFRGMIQDMHGPEFYLEKFEVMNLETRQTCNRIGKYVDIVGCENNESIDAEGPSAVKGERHTYVAISIPAINSWVSKMEEDKFKCQNSATNPSSSVLLKRPLEAMDTEENCTEDATNSPSESNKKQCTETSKPNIPNVISQEHLLNFPIPDSKGRVCHIKIYSDSDSLKLNSVCEFVGFLSVDPVLASHNLDEMNSEEFQVHNPPPSLVPRIHCVSFKHLTHNNPLITDQQMSGDKMQHIRKELLILLTQLMLGDDLAAEYLLYHLISEVYLRKDLMALGKFALNISNIPKFESLDYVQELYKFLELLTTKCHYLGMSLENMNELTFIPKKDYTSDRLTSSILQLSPNTHLVLDETKLSAGKLNEAGVAGVKALANVIKNQKTTYDFTYYQLEFDCDIPFLILSEGKSMLPSDMHVILQPEQMHLSTFSEILEAGRHFLKQELLNEMRVYLTTARTIHYEISNGMEELVQKEFVHMRQKANVSGDDLHNLLVLARLVCISQGKNTLDEECWRKACSLEDNRRRRIPK